MSLENFELFVNETFDNSTIKRDFIKAFHKKGANLNNPDQNLEFTFGENSNCHQIGNAYPQNELTVKKHNKTDFTNKDALRLIKNAFAYCFEERQLATTGGSILEPNKYLGNISTIMRMLTSRNGDLWSGFDKTSENNTDDDYTLKQILINNHEVAEIKEKTRGQLALELNFGFCRTL